MLPSRHAPQQLKIMAYLFMIEGFLWFASMIVLALSRILFFNPCVLIIFIGWGLLCLKRWAYLLTWFYLLCSVFVLMIGGLASFVSWSNYPSELFCLLPLTASFLILLVKFWQVNVLDSPPVRRAFGLPDRN